MLIMNNTQNVFIFPQSKSLKHSEHSSISFFNNRRKRNSATDEQGYLMNSSFLQMKSNSPFQDASRCFLSPCDSLRQNQWQKRFSKIVLPVAK